MSRPLSPNGAISEARGAPSRSAEQSPSFFPTHDRANLHTGSPSKSDSHDPTGPHLMLPDLQPHAPVMNLLDSAMQPDASASAVTSPGSNDAENASPRRIVRRMTPGSQSIAQSGSPFSRAGLLQPRSFASTLTASSNTQPIPVRPTLSQNAIRDSTMQLSGINVNISTPAQDEFIFPQHPPAAPSIPASSIASSAFSSRASSAVDLTASTSSAATMTTSSTTAAAQPPSPETPALSATPRPHEPPLPPGPGASGLTLLLAEHGASSRESSCPRAPPTPPLEEPSERAPLLPTPGSDLEAARQSYVTFVEEPERPITKGGDDLPEPGRFSHLATRNLKLPPLAWKGRPRPTVKSLRNIGKDIVSAVPAVMLGTLLNILDGVSYGMIIFPAAGVFAGLGAMGVSMFFVSAIVAQVIYSAGASGFAGANGSMMIEVVPFFHILAARIAADMGEDKPSEIIATTLVAFAFSSVLTGLTFFLLGAFRLGNLIGFFPRHILVGCIGGVGVFLMITGLTVCTRMPDDDFALSFATFKFLFLEASNLVLWAPAFVLAVLLRLITHRWHHQLILPIYFIVIFVVFYIVVAAARLDLQVLRKGGWLFDDEASAEPWYNFYTYFDFGKTQWGPLWATLPTQFALLFFNILHPPLNVPALAVSLGEDVDTNKELVAHGYSNMLAGLLGSVPNYLVYVNTLLFYRVGGSTRVSGFMLAGATALLLFIGTGPIAYIPVMVVGALIFVLGIDLVKEALWDTRQRVNRLEYITIVSIMIAMTVWDFVIGVFFGIIISCLFFVVQNSQRRSIRAIYSGAAVMSTVRRPSAHRAYIREVSKQTTVIRLQGFIFFGTITHIEETIRMLVEDAAWHGTPMQFLVVDMLLCAGVDLSAAEAFVRIQRVLAAKRIVLVFCGITSTGNIGQALESVGLFDMEGVELFGTLNEAMEWTENAYLRAWFLSVKAETKPIMLPGRQDGIDLAIRESLPSSPRRNLLRDVGGRMFPRTSPDLEPSEEKEPYNTLLQAFSSYGPVDRAVFRPIASYLERLALPEGSVLWKQDDPPDGLYIVEAGVLRATYQFAEHMPRIEESMVPGTLAGELSALSDLPRNATAVVERPAVLWKLSTANLRRMEVEQPELARTFTTLVIKSAKIDYDILLSALAARQ